MSRSGIGVSKIWLGEISDPTQFLSLLSQRIATLGGAYYGIYEITFDTVRQQKRHIEHWDKYCKKNKNDGNKNKNKSKNDKKGSDKKNKNDSINNNDTVITSNLLSNSTRNKSRIVPKSCLSTLRHSKEYLNESVFVMFDNHIIESSSLLTTQFIDPFALKKRTKSIYVRNGECHKWGDFLIYSGQLSFHSSPSDYVIIEIEYQCIHTINTNTKNANDSNKNHKSQRILQEVFHWIATPLQQIVVYSKVHKYPVLTELEKNELKNNKNEKKSDDNDVQMSDNSKANKNNNTKEMQDVVLELDNDKGEPIKWLTIPNIDFSLYHIDDTDHSKYFSGRHLGALYASALSQINVE